jgi:hypothetical protein
MDNPIFELADSARNLTGFAGRIRPRPDWHEPDEQGITAKVDGKTFDNAFGDSGEHWGKDGEFSEKILILKVNGEEELRINLATLCALATFGSRVLLSE